jgi:carboxyl-terminal processing protease
MDRKTKHIKHRITVAAPALRLTIAAIIATALHAQGEPVAASRMSPEAAAYLDSALGVMQTNYLHRDRIDWPKVRHETIVQAGGAQTTIETYPAIRFALASIGDFHSFLMLTPALERAEAAQKPRLANPAAMPARPARKISFPYPSPFQARRVPEGAMVATAERPLAQIVIPLFASGDRKEIDAFATKVQSTIATLAANRPCGWIVDLRGNGGGNIWPMLAGIGPLLGEGSVGGRMYSDGRRVMSFYHAGAAGDSSETPPELYASTTDAPVVVPGTPPVAVLIDRATGSSGEGVAVAFRARPDTRFFGEATFGASTSTFPFGLGDGAQLYLVTAVMIDKKGEQVEFGITPDEEVLSEATISDNDPVIQRASQWLVSQKACAAKRN